MNEDNTVIDLKCPEENCGAPMVLMESKRFKDSHGHPRKFYGCSQWRVTGCPGIHGAHPDGRPLGIPANKETKRWRIKAHDVFDMIWKQHGLTREEAYSMLQHIMGMTPSQAHIGRFTIEECQKLIEKVRVLFPEKHE